MARENQGLQIALIIFVMLTIILGVTTFLFFRQYQEKDIAAKEARQQATENKNSATTIQDHFNTLKGYCGFDATATIDTIGEDYRTHMDKFAANLPEQNRNYIAALQDQSATIDAKNASLASSEAANSASLVS